MASIVAVPSAPVDKDFFANRVSGAFFNDSPSLYLNPTTYVLNLNGAVHSRFNPSAPLTLVSLTEAVIV